MEKRPLEECKQAGIRELPPQVPRVESGTIKFGDDWPGTFFRGDDSFACQMSLRGAIQILQQTDLNGSSIIVVQLKAMVQVLSQCTED